VLAGHELVSEQLTVVALMYAVQDFAARNAQLAGNPRAYHHWADMQLG
jgi:hypothetical protein